MVQLSNYASNHENYEKKTKIKNSVADDWVVEINVKDSINIFEY